MDDRAPFDPANPAFVRDPYPVYARYRERDPVYRVVTTACADPTTWYIFRYEDVERLLTRLPVGRNAGKHEGSGALPANLAMVRSVIENWLVFQDPPRHTQLRAIIGRAFTPGVTRALRPRIAAIVNDLIRDVEAEPAFDLVDRFAAPLPIRVIAELLGVAREDGTWLRERAVALQGASSAGRQRDASLATAEIAAAELSAYFRDEVTRRRRAARDDLIAGLVSAGTLSEVEIVATCIHLLTAGHETTTNLITKATVTLLSRRNVVEDLRSDPALMPAAVDEFIRYDAPVQMISRWALENFVVRRRQVSRGDRLVLVLGSANRDPRRFSDPDTLDIHRYVGRHCGFGMGVHYCIGALLAHAEAEIALLALVRQFPGLRLADEPIEYAPDLIFHGPTRLHVTRKGLGSHTAGD